MNSPPPMPPSYQMMQDAEHLKLLGIFHYVLGGFSIIGMFFGVLYGVMGTVMFKALSTMPTHPSSASPSGPTGPPPQMMDAMKWMFIAYGTIITLVCLVSAIGHFLSGKYMAQRKNRTFCLIVAGASCLFMPLGTVLGVFSIIVLIRPTVAALFERKDGTAKVGLAAPDY